MAWEDAMRDAQGKIEFILAKRRNGTTGTAMGSFYGAYQAVR
jgi:replicative DNA helicase